MFVLICNMVYVYSSPARLKRSYGHAMRRAPSGKSFHSLTEPFADITFTRRFLMQSAPYSAVSTALVLGIGSLKGPSTPFAVGKSVAVSSENGLLPIILICFPGFTM